MLKIKNLSYGKVLRNISLDFSPGKIYGVLGPNGAGKTTFLKTVAHIWQPTEGEVLWQEQNLMTLSRKEISRTISLVPQSPPPSFDFSVEDMVAMGRYAHPNKENNKAVVEDALKKVDVWRLRDRKISEVSAGERQRVYIGRALTTEAQVLLLDEPTANLDIRHQLDIWEILKLLSKQGKILIVSLHDFTAADRYCDEVVVLNQGCCASTGAYASVMTPKLLQDVFNLENSNKH